MALGAPVGSRPFGKSTLQLFRPQFVIQEKASDILMKSLAPGKKVSYLKSRKMNTVLATTPVVGGGEVNDTCNLLAEGIARLMDPLAKY